MGSLYGSDTQQAKSAFRDRQSTLQFTAATKPRVAEGRRATVPPRARKPQSNNVAIESTMSRSVAPQSAMAQPRTARVTDARRERIKAFDRQCKERIEEHLNKQKHTQTLGLDFHIFDDPDGVTPIAPPARV